MASHTKQSRAWSTLSVRITQPQRDALEALAARESNTITSIVRRIITMVIKAELQVEAPVSRPRPRRQAATLIDREVGA